MEQEREAEAVALDERREGGEGEEDEGIVWRRRNLARGRVTSVSVARATTGPTRVSQQAKP